MESKIQKSLMQTKIKNKFSKRFKTYLDEDAFYNFINSMIKESKCYSDVIKKHFNKELVMTIEDNEDFKNLNVVSVTMIMLIMMLK